MKLDSVVPWGRSFQEYRSIFSLSEGDLQKKLLGCGDGPACFNAEVTLRGGNVVSVDPVYQFSGDQIRSRIDEVYPQIMSQMEQNAESYIWESIKDVAELGKVRMDAMQQFLSDYDAGLEAGRYTCASLPYLPFDDQQFELALCSHFLFLYSEHFDLEQHIQGMRELCRVATEVRVYPLLSLDGKQSKHLSAVIEALAGDGVRTSLQPVDYQFQKGATEMLVANPV
ncbi:SAM-dependent methyltransferase [Zobellella endophytica]|uniref:SAM-dependent methyltransferase n=1 Tax=Zobellella endophytica TaxID=2116700 RepID=A0A2P7RBQ0_9GAMM|nr:class I SAM-dependent methyltransferase [Zobellella endophytica]PSJ47651.1 SAM-dependent methyltransferase [Zobellella endophytica]